MNPNVNKLNRQKVIFYIGDELSDRTILQFNTPSRNTTSHNNVICSDTNITIHRIISTNTLINNNTILKLFFNILEKLF